MKLHELENSLDKSLIFKPYNEAKEILESNGFTVIRPFDVKRVYLEAVKDLDTANKLHLFSPYSEIVDDKLLDIYNKFDRIILKDTRINSSSFETLNSYLEYRSGCFYNWFNPFTGEPKL